MASAIGRRRFVPRAAFIPLLLAATFPLGARFGEAQTISFVQVNYTVPQTPQPSVAVPYTLAQTAKDLNIVVVGWNDSTAHVQAVTDTSGNVYALAVGPTVQAGIATQSIYYARSILPAGAGANTVTVQFDVAATY